MTQGCTPLGEGEQGPFGVVRLFGFHPATAGGQR
jgi:hypothetical protein